ncbi:MAG: alpha/beta fold hydrolase [Pseudomonadota bacterium]
MTETVLFLPGMMCDARLFAPQIDALSRDHGVMVAPMGGGERIEEIASQILSIAPAKFALAGLSMGGIVAMEIMRRAPDRVTRLCLMDTNPHAEAPERAAAREPQIVAARAGRLREIMRDEMKPAYLAWGSHRSEVLELVMDMADKLGPEVFVRQSRALQKRRSQETGLHRISCPTLILCGAEDSLCPPDRHAFMAELIPGAELEVIRNAGHLPPLETPAAVTGALRSWLARPAERGR